MINPQATPEAVPPAPGPVPAGTAPPIDMTRLPYSVRGVLSWLPENEWHLVHAIVCHGAFIREFAEVARFLDAVWTNSKKAEDRVNDRLTGAERDGFRERVDRATREVVQVAVELARRARLTEILQRNRPLVVRYVPEGAEKSRPRKVESEKKPEPTKETRPARPTEPAPERAPAGPDFVNRWLSGIRRIRQTDPSFARSAEVISMFQKALEIAGPRRAEIEHQLAQYQEAMRHAEAPPGVDPEAMDAPPAEDIPSQAA